MNAVAIARLKPKGSVRPSRPGQHHADAQVLNAGAHPISNAVAKPCLMPIDGVRPPRPGHSRFDAQTPHAGAHLFSNEG